MNSKVKGILQILLVLILIAAFGIVAYRGIGSARRGSAQNIRLGLDLKGGVSVTYEATKADPTEQEMQDTVYKMQKRVEDISTEASVYQEGANRVTIDIPGVSNASEILQKLGQAGALQFVLYENIKGKDGKASPDEGEEVTFDAKDVEMDGKMISNATATTQQSATGATENVVKIDFTGKGTKTFGKVTGDHVNERLAIIYDNKLVSAPNIESEIADGTAVVHGGFDEFSEAEDMASTLRIGALPLELKNIHDNVVGATLGSEALRTSLIAGIVGFILVILFMIFMYRVPGAVASVALVFYIGAMLLILN